MHLIAAVARAPAATLPVTLPVLFRSLDVGVETALETATFRSEGYQRRQIFLSEHVELLLMSWLPGQRSRIHDHGGSLCVFRVLAGEATEVRYELGRDGRAKPIGAAHLSAGASAAAQDAEIHALGNDGRSAVPLVTLHAYSPPLQMRFYEAAE